jgi:hypothetical protein
MKCRDAIIKINNNDSQKAFSWKEGKNEKKELGSSMSVAADGLQSSDATNKAQIY